MNRSVELIIQHVWRRKDSGYSDEVGFDGQHIALVLEGGGMRGVATGGMVSALEELGLTNCFDSVHGSSAGAAAGAYFVAGQAALGTRIFFEDLNDQRFISPSRVLRFAPIMDTAYLVDYVMDKIKPIDFKEIQLNSGKLNIVCTDIDAGRSIIYNDFDEYEHYKDVLRASVTLPFIAGRPQEIDGRRLMDAVMALTLQLEVLDKIE